MSFIKDLSKQLDKAASVIAKKTEEFSDAASITIKIKAIENTIDEDYEAIGKVVYPLYKESGAVRTPEVDAAIEKLEADLLKLADLKEEQEAMKRAKEAKKAANAQAQQDKEDAAKKVKDDIAN